MKDATVTDKTPANTAGKPKVTKAPAPPTAPGMIGQEDLSALTQAIKNSGPPDFVERGAHWYTRLGRRFLRGLGRMVLRAFRRAGVRRRITAPIFIGCLAWIASAIMSLIDKGWLTLLAAYGVGMLPLYWWLGGWVWKATRVRGLKPAEHRWWYGSAYATMVALSMLTVTWKLGPPVPFLWILGVLTFWTRWMIYHYGHRRKKVSGEDRHAKWMKIKKLEGTTLGDITDHDSPRRWVAEVDLVEVDYLVEGVMKATPYIAKRYGVPRSSVIVDEASPGADIAARVTVVHENLTHKPVIYDESWAVLREDGTFPFHMYSDGWAGSLRLFTRFSGTTNSLFSGDIGSGKSAALTSAAITAMDSGLVYLIVGDPQGGQSMPILAGDEGVARMKATDPEGVYYQLRGIRAAMLARSRVLQKWKWKDKYGDTQVGMPFFDTYLTGWPILLYLLDEAHKACLDPEWGPLIIPLLEEVIKLSRKTGIAVWPATQYPGIEELGNKMAIRQNLITGNIVALRNSATTTGSMILPNYMPSPFEIPRETPAGDMTQGTAIIMSAATRSSRPSYSRTVYVERQAMWARLAASKMPSLDEVSGNAFADVNELREQERLGREKAAEEMTPEARERIEVPVKPGKKKTALEAAIEYLETKAPLEEGLPAMATTGTLAHYADVTSSAMSMALKRAAEQGYRIKDEGHAMWSLIPGPAAPRQKKKRGKTLAGADV